MNKKLVAGYLIAISGLIILLANAVVYLFGLKLIVVSPALGIALSVIGGAIIRSTKNTGS